MTQTDLHPVTLASAGCEPVSPVPDLVRIAVSGQHRHIDLSLPLDVPFALLLPEIVHLFEDGAGADDGPKDVVWVLVGAESGEVLEPGGTLRDAGVAQDDLLYLRGRRTLAAPTLYDDVVDAAAHLNQTGHPGWDPAAARRMAYLGICLAVAAWIYVVLVDASSPRRAELLGLTAFATVTLLVVAAIVPRSGGEPQVGAVLGWACLPIAAAGCWAGLSPYGSLALAGGALALIVLCVAGHRLVGAGVGGFTAAGVFFACGATSLAVHAAGVTGFTAAVGLAVAATVATTAVPRLTARLDYSRPARPDAPIPDDVDMGRRVARARALRGGLYAGLAVGACFAGTVVVWSGATPARATSWPTLTFGVVCAAALGLPRPTAPTGLVRAASGLPAVALVVAVALAAVRGDEPVSVVGFSALLAGVILLATIGSESGSAKPRPRRRALLASASYLACALVVPSALWAAGAHAPWGVG